MIAAVLLTATLFAAAAPAPSTSTAATPELRERLLVFGLKAEGVDQRIVQSIERAIVKSAVDAGYDAISSQDIATLLDIEANRQAAGCDGESSCVAELAGGLGAKLVVTGSVVKLSARRYELSLILLEQNATTVKNRASVDADSSAELRELAGGTAARLLGAADAASSDHSSAVVWIGGGSGAVVAGAVGVVFGALQLKNAAEAFDAVNAAADAYKDNDSRSNLNDLADANAGYRKWSGNWNSWGAPMAVIGGAVAVAGVVGIVIGVTELQ